MAVATGDGERVRSDVPLDFIDVDDVALLYVAALMRADVGHERIIAMAGMFN